MNDGELETVGPGVFGEDSHADLPASSDDDDSDSQIRDLGRAEIASAESDDDEVDAITPGQVAPWADGGVRILTRLLDLLGLEGDVVCDRTEDSVVLNIEGDDLGVLIGRRGLTLSALQYVVRLMIASGEGEWPAVSVDVCGYKRRRHVALEELARKLADQAKYRHRPVTLEPMPADERRVVHLALANNPDVYTESIGEDSERKVVIHPKKV
jgi:spoIIIJ-associated protein